MDKYRKITVSSGEVFYEDLNKKIIFQKIDGKVEVFQATPDAFYKFRTDVKGVEETDRVEDTVTP